MFPIDFLLFPIVFLLFPIVFLLFPIVFDEYLIHVYLSSRVNPVCVNPVWALAVLSVVLVVVFGGAGGGFLGSSGPCSLVVLS